MHRLNLGFDVDKIIAQVNKFGTVIAATRIGLAVSLSSLRYVGAARTRDFNLEVIDFKEKSKR